MRIGVCAALDKLTRPVDGLDYVEASVEDALCPRLNDAAFTKRLAVVKAMPLPVEVVNMLMPGDMKTTGPAVNVQTLDAYMSIVVSRAAKMGVKVIVFASGGSRRVPDGFDSRRAANQIAVILQRWGMRASPHQIVIALEPLNKAECNIINTLDEAADTVRRDNSPNVRIMADTYHMAKDGESPEAIKRARGLLAHAHCSEADGHGPLGTRGENHRPYFRAMKDIGYNARLSIEARWENFERQLPAAIAELRKQWDTA